MPESTNQSDAKIKLYTYPKCPFCLKVTKFLKENGLLDKITIINANKAENYQALKEVSKKTVCPYLHDEVHGVKMPESSRIIAYFKQIFNV